MNWSARHLSLVSLALALSGCGQSLAAKSAASAPPSRTPTTIFAPATVTPTAMLTPAATTPPPPTTTPVATRTPTPAPTLTPSPTRIVWPTPTEPLIMPTLEGYSAYRVRDGDTLTSIAARGGTTPWLLRHYNQLAGEPPVGRPLIVPRLAGQPTTLPDEILVVERGTTARPWVALTLDCGGENPRTHDILETLKAAHARITFFIQGDSIRHDPELLRRIVADGHELANHSLTHTDFTTLTDEEIGEELRRTEEIVREIAGAPVSLRPFARLPYGAYSPRALHAVIANGYLPVHWTLDSLDAFGQPKSPAYLVQRLTTMLPFDKLPGAITLSHCLGATADALPEVLRTYRALGLEVRPLSDVLGP